MAAKSQRKKLTPRQRRFVDAFIRDPNATKAAIKAGYSEASAKVQGARLLTKANVRAEVEAFGTKATEKAEFEATDVLRELSRIAFADIRQAFTADGRLKSVHELPENVARCISGIENEELWDDNGDGERIRTGDVRKLKFWDKNKALEALGKFHKLFAERVDVKHSFDFEGLIAQSYDEGGGQ